MIEKEEKIMDSILKLCVIAALAGITYLGACTTMIITKGASIDGSMMVAHSDDSEIL